jgi:non-homologous end joining protein Ku
VSNEGRLNEAGGELTKTALASPCVLGLFLELQELSAEPHEFAMIPSWRIGAASGPSVRVRSVPWPRVPLGRVTSSCHWFLVRLPSIRPRQVRSGESSHTISIDTFVPRTEIDDRYLDSPYYIAPTDKVGQEAFAVIRDAIRDKGMVALGRVVLSRREHVMMLEAFDKGLLATVLRYSYEVRDQAAYFEDISDLKLPADMKELAAHIVDSKTSHFDPSTFVDHYETALVDLLRAKQVGRVIEAPKAEPAPHRVINLMDALRASIGGETKKKPAAVRARAAAGAKRKTGR